MPKKKGPNKHTIPKPILDHLDDAIEAHENLIKIVHISQRGMGILLGVPNAVKVLQELDSTISRSAKAQQRVSFEQAQAEAELAEAEIKKGFPILYGFAVVAIWGWLEHAIKGFLVLWIVHYRDSLRIAEMQKLRIKLGDYIHLQKAEQAHLLVELLERELASPLRQGGDRFTSLLEPFGFRIDIPTDCSKALYELQQVRNVIAHRNGRADRKFRSACPWLPVKLGQPVQISGAMLRSYSVASIQFLTALIENMAARQKAQATSKK